MRPTDAEGLHDDPALAVRAGPARPEWCSKTLLELDSTAPEAYERISESVSSQGQAGKCPEGEEWAAEDEERKIEASESCSAAEGAAVLRQMPEPHELSPSSST